MKIADFIIIFSNVLFFIVVQTIFYKYVASKQIDILVTEKTGILNEFLKNTPFARKDIHTFITSEEATKIRTQSQKDKEHREELNRIVMLKWIGIPFGACILFLIMSVIVQINLGSSWTSSDTFLLIMIVSAYATELVIYFGIMKQYEFIGDNQLYYLIYKKVKNKLENKLENKLKTIQSSKDSRQNTDGQLANTLASMKNKLNGMGTTGSSNKDNLFGLLLEFASTFSENHQDWRNQQLDS